MSLHDLPTNQPLIRSNSGNYFWTIGSVDCHNVAEQFNAGIVLRPGGFRETICLLMLAGF